jgi:hypothetical protein
MDKVVLNCLTLLDLGRNPVKLNECFHNYLLLIFLRHLA